MGTIAKVTAGGGTHLVASTAFATCGTAAATAAKVATVQDEQAFTLFTGITIHIKFTYSNTVANPTLNVNGTGAKAIMRYGTTRPSTSVATSWFAGAVVSFTYDGTYWIMNDYTDNTTYASMPQTEASTGTATTGRLITAKVLHDTITSLEQDTTYTAGKGLTLNEEYGANEFSLSFEVGDHLSTNGATNPSGKYGGSWVLAEKQFKAAAYSYSSGDDGSGWESSEFDETPVTWNTSNVRDNNLDIRIRREGMFFFFRFTWRNKVQYADTTLTLFTLNATRLGLDPSSGGDTYALYPVGYSDGLNSVLATSLTWSGNNGTLRLLDTIYKSSQPTGTDQACTISFIQPTSIGQRANSACMQFIWEKVS